MKKVKTITATYHRSNNYGASLQAYALQQTLESLDIENEIIDFSDAFIEKEKFFKGNIRRDIAYFAIKLVSLKHKKETNRLHRNFEQFTETYLHLTRRYESFEAVHREPPVADYYITGSDQVFTFRNSDSLVALRMLQFGSEEVRRISYAASLADYDLSEKEKKKFAEILNQFDHVSVREKSSVPYLASFLDREYCVNIDPVFLLSRQKWHDFATKPRIEGPYILYFQVNGNSIANDVIGMLHKKYALPVICLQTNPLVRVKNDYLILDASPQEFVGLFENASIVVTTSFHGTVFSLLFEKEFYVLTKPTSNPIRIRDLLDMFGNQDRMIDSCAQVDHVREIDFQKVRDTVKSKRNEAIKYLSQMKDPKR